MPNWFKSATGNGMRVKVTDIYRQVQVTLCNTSVTYLKDAVIIVLSVLDAYIRTSMCL